VEIKALLFALIRGSPGAEIVFLDKNLAIRLTTIIRGLHANLLCTLPHRLFDFVDEPRNRLRLIKFHDDVLDGVGTRTEPTRASRPRVFIKQIFNRVRPVLG
jgi:hypothetical protein